MIICAVVFLVFLALNVPLAFALGISGLLFFIITPELPIAITVQRLVAATQSFPLLAVPFFVMAGHLMNAAGITRRLMRFANVLTGHMRGGLAHVSIVLSGLMGGISGSANADAAMESRILGPEMLRKGYTKGYTAAVIACSSLITATIPPSLGLIIFGFVGEVSIGRLFVAGVIPGLLMMAAQMIAATIVAHRRAYAPDRERMAGIREILSEGRECIWALLFPLLLIVGIRFGVFTPSEAGAFAAVYALIVGLVIYKELTWKSFAAVLKYTVIDNGIIMMIIMCAAILSFGIAYDRVPQALSSMILGTTTHRVALWLIVIAFLFFAGMFMEATVNTLILTPILLPIMESVGVDPVHFGVLMMILVTMGGMTPPVGVTMFTVCSLLDCPTKDFVKDFIPFIVSIVVLVMVLVFLPDLVLFLPNLVFG